MSDRFVNIYNLPDFDFDKDQYEQEIMKAEAKWDEHALEAASRLYDEYKSKQDKDISYLDPRHTGVPGLRYSYKPFVIKNKLYNRVIDKVSAVGSDFIESISSEEYNEREKWLEYYYQKNKERFDALPDEHKNTEIAFGGLPGIDRYKFDRSKLFDITFFNNLERSFSQEIFNKREAVYGDYLDRLHPTAASAGQMTGSILALMAASSAVSQLGIPVLAAKILGTSKLATVIGAPTAYASRMKGFKLAVNGLKNIAMKYPALSWISKTPSWYETGAQAAPMVVSQLATGAITAGIRTTALQLHAEDKLSLKDYTIKMAEEMGAGAIQRWGIGLINAPSSWGARFVGDALYSGSQQLFRIATGKQMNFDSNLFWKDYIVGHAMGEAQSWFLGGGRTTADVKTQSGRVGKKAADNLYGQGESPDKDMYKNIVDNTVEKLQTDLLNTKQAPLNDDELLKFANRIAPAYQYFVEINRMNGIETKKIRTNDPQANVLEKSTAFRVNKARELFDITEQQSKVLLTASENLKNIEAAHKYLSGIKYSEKTIEEQIEAGEKTIINGDIIKPNTPENMYALFDTLISKDLFNKTYSKMTPVEKSQTSLLKQFEDEALQRKEYRASDEIEKELAREIAERSELAGEAEDHGIDRIDKAIWTKFLNRFFEKNPNNILEKIKENVGKGYRGVEISAKDIDDFYGEAIIALYDTKNVRAKNDIFFGGDIDKMTPEDIKKTFEAISYFLSPKNIRNKAYTAWKKEHIKASKDGRLKLRPGSLDKTIPGEEGSETTVGANVIDQRVETDPEMLKQAAGIFMKIIDIGGTKSGINTKLPSVYASWLAKTTTLTHKEIAEYFNSIGIKKIRGEGKYEEDNIKVNITNVDKLAERIFKRMEDAAKNIRPKKVITTEKVVTRKPTYSKKAISSNFSKIEKDIENVNSKSFISTEFDTEDMALINKNDGFVIDADAMIKDIINKYGLAAADQMLYHQAKIIEKIMLNIDGIKTVSIIQPKDSNKFYIATDGLPKTQLNNIMDMVHSELTAKFTNNKFTFTMVDKNDKIDVTLSRLNGLNYIKFRYDDISRETFEKDIDNFVTKLEAVKRYTSVVSPENHEKLQELRINYAAGSKIVNDINKVYDLTSFKNQAEILEWVQTPESVKQVEKINELISSLPIVGGGLINTRINLFTTKTYDTDKIILPAPEINGADKIEIMDEMNIIRTIAKKGVEGLGFSFIESGRSDMLSELEAGKGLGSKMFEGIKKVGPLNNIIQGPLGEWVGKFSSSFRDWFAEKTSTTMGKEEWDKNYRNIQRNLIEAIRDSGESFSDQWAMLAFHLALPKDAKDLLWDMGQETQSIFIKWIPIMLETELVPLLKYNPNLNSKIKYVGGDDGKAKADVLGRLSGFSVNKGIVGDASNVALLIHKSVETGKDAELFPLSKILVQRYGATKAQIVNTLVNLYDKMHMPVYRSAGSYSPHVLLEKFHTKAEDEFSLIMNKNVPRKDGDPPFKKLGDMDYDEAKAWANLLPADLKKKGDMILKTFYVDMNKETWNYVHHFTLQHKENADKFYRSFSNWISRGEEFHGKERAENTFKDFVRRELGTYYVAIEKGYIMSENGLTDAMTIFKYGITREMNHRVPEMMRNTFLDQCLTAKKEGWLPQFLQHLTGAVYIPMDDQISAVRKISKTANEAKFLVGKGSKEYNDQLQKEKHYDNLAKKMQAVQDIMLDKNNLIELEKSKISLVPMRKKSWIKNSASREITKDGVVKNAGNTKEKYQFLKKQVTTRWGDENRYEASNIDGWDGIFVDKTIFVSFKNWILKDDFLKYDSSYEFKNMFWKKYDQINRVARTLGWWNALIVGMNDLQQSLMLAPGSLKNTAWSMNRVHKLLSFEDKVTKFEDIADAKLDTDSLYVRSLERNDLFNSSTGRSGYIDGFAKEAIKMAESTGEIGAIIKRLKSLKGVAATTKELWGEYQQLTWILDRVMRLSAGKYQMDRWFAAENTDAKNATPEQWNLAGYYAARLTNQFLGEYRRMPMFTKQLLNRFGLVPGFRWLMMRMHGKNIRNAIMGSYKLAGQTHFGGHKIDDYEFAPLKKGRVSGSIELAMPAIRWALSIAVIKMFASALLGFDDNTKKDLLLGYRMRKKTHPDDPFMSETQFLSLSGPVFEWQKHISRPLLVTLHYQMARLPQIAMMFASGRHPRTRQNLYKKPWTEAPKENAARLGAAIFESYIPFGSLVLNMADEDRTAFGNIISYSGIGYYYKYKSPKDLYEKFRLATDTALPYDERLKLSKDFYQAYKIASEALFDTKFKAISEQYREEYEMFKARGKDE